MKCSFSSPLGKGPRMIRCVLFIATATFAQTVYTEWRSHNVHFRRDIAIVINETTSSADSIFSHKTFELAIPGQSSRVHLTLGVANTIRQAELEVSAGSNWFLSSFFKSSPNNGDRPVLGVWGAQDSIDSYLMRDTLNWNSVAYHDIQADLWNQVYYGESNNNFFYYYRFVLPVDLNTSANLNSMMNVLAGIDFIDKNLNGSPINPASAKRTQAEGNNNMRNKKSVIFRDILGRKRTNSTWPGSPIRRAPFEPRK